MSSPMSPFEQGPPSARRLLWTIAASLACAALILILVVLPAEYGIDTTGFGRLTGIAKLHASARSLQIKDVLGGNENYRETEVQNPPDPVPLPNPSVSQLQPTAPRAETLTVRLESGQATEVKAVIGVAQVLLYSWTVEGGEVYVDFHGHEPDAGDAFVRYDEQQSVREGNGSLVAPFTGEHGWYWINVADQPVEITLQVVGYHHELKNYGLIEG